MVPRSDRRTQPAAPRRDRDQPRRARDRSTDAIASADTVSPTASLHGIPVLIKDNIATDDQMETGAGSLALVGSRVPTTRRSSAGCARPVRSCSARRTSRSGRTSAASRRSTAGAPRRDDGELHPQPVRARPRSVRIVVRIGDRRPPPTSPRSRSAPRPTGRSSARRVSRTWSASSRRSASCRSSGIIPIARQPGHGRPDDPHGRRRGGPAQRPARRRSGRVARSPPAARLHGRSSASSRSAELRLLVDTNYIGGDLGTSARRAGRVRRRGRGAPRRPAPRSTPSSSADPLEPIDGLVPFDAEFTVLLFEFKVQIAEYLATVCAAPTCARSPISSSSTSITAPRR